MKKKKVYFNLIFIEDVEEKWTFAFHVSTLIEVSTYAQWCRFPQGVPLVRYHGTFKDLNMNWIWAGNDPTLGKMYICSFHFDAYFTTSNSNYSKSYR